MEKSKHLVTSNDGNKSLISKSEFTVRSTNKNLIQHFNQMIINTEHSISNINLIEALKNLLLCFLFSFKRSDFR